MSRPYLHISNTRHLILAMFIVAMAGALISPLPAYASGTGRVAVYPANPHYLMDANGKPFLLIGYGNETLNDVATLDKLHGNVNYMRCYLAVYVRKFGWNTNWENQPWGVVDGRVDMDTWNAAYWKELRKRLAAAQKRNIVVGLTIWDGHTALPGGKAGDESFWNSDRNVQGLQWAYDATALDKYPHPRKTGDSAERLVYYQRRVVDKLLAEIRPFPNVIIELNNEDSRGSSPEWWLWWAKYFKDRGYVVAVNEALSGGISDRVFISTPDIDMKSYHKRTDKELLFLRYTVNKVIVADADNLCTDLDPDTARRIAWKSVLRGGGWNDFVCAQQPFPNELKTAYYGHLLKFIASLHVPFWEMVPEGNLASSRYALVKPGTYYLVYAESDVKVDLSGADGTLHYRWLDPRNGKIVESGTVQGGSKQTFKIPVSRTGGWLETISHVFSEPWRKNDYILWIAATRPDRNDAEG